MCTERNLILYIFKYTYKCKELIAHAHYNAVIVDIGAIFTANRKFMNSYHRYYL